MIVIKLKIKLNIKVNKIEIVLYIVSKNILLKYSKSYIKVKMNYISYN